MRRASKTLMVLALACAAGCASTAKEPSPDWQSSELEAPSDRVLWKVALQSLQRRGFPLGAGLDRGSMTVESGWRNDLQPFSGEGMRLAAELHMVPVRRGVWRVEARVKKQVNQNLGRPLDPRFAEWEWTADETEEARILVQHIRSLLDPAIEPVERVDDPVEAYLEARDAQADGR